MANIFKVSQSKVKTWRRCRQAYWYRYVMKLRRIFKSRPLQFGTIVHNMIEEDANGRDPMKYLRKLGRDQGEMFRVQREAYGEIIDDARLIMTEYFNHWEDYDLIYVNLKGKRAEHSFEVEIADGLIATGKLDNIAKSKGLRWLVEHKTFSQMPNDDHRWRNIQPAVYIEVNDRLGLPPLDGILWDYIRSKPPSYPQILKSGKMSARGLDSLPLRIIETFKERGININEPKFKGLMKSAKQNRSRYFQRIHTPVRPKVVKSLFGDFVNTAQEMRKLHGQNEARVRNIDRHCDWCDYEPLCRAALMGLDEKFIMKREYTNADEGHEPKEPDFEG